MKIAYAVELLDSQDDWSRLAEALGGEHLDVVRNTLRHLRVLGAKSYVLEDPYIDRDYSADYLHCLRLAGRGEKIHEKVCRYGGRVPIREVWRARAMTAAVRRVLGLSETLGTCASSASNETRRS